MDAFPHVDSSALRNALPNTFQNRTSTPRLDFNFRWFFNDVLSIETVWHRMVGWEVWFGKELERSGRGLIEVLSWHLPERIEETTNNLSQDGSCFGRNSNGASPEYRSRALSLEQRVRWRVEFASDYRILCVLACVNLMAEALSSTVYGKYLIQLKAVP
jgi:hypothetical protein